MMSKYKEITTQITDPDHITAALDDMGVPYEVAAAGQEIPLYGYQGDQRDETGAVVVRREHIGSASNDIGWSLDPETGAYQLYLSEYDAGSVKAARNIVEGVAQRCAFYKLQELAAQNGFAVDTLTEFDVQRIFIGR